MLEGNDKVKIRLQQWQEHTNQNALSVVVYWKQSLATEQAIMGICHNDTQQTTTITAARCLYAKLASRIRILSFENTPGGPGGMSV